MYVGVHSSIMSTYNYYYQKYIKITVGNLLYCTIYCYIPYTLSQILTAILRGNYSYLHFIFDEKFRVVCHLLKATQNLGPGFELTYF